METSLNIRSWKEALSEAIPDPAVGISLARLAGNVEFSTYVTEIGPFRQVEAHYHPEGVEIYHILSGQGEMHTGYLNNQSGVVWNKPQLVKEGDFFTIYPNMIHQLKNNFEIPLILIVTCSPTNLGENRIRVPSC